MALLLADGQLAASSETLLGVAANERTVAVTLFNTAAQEQSVSLTVTRGGSSARTVARAELKQYESLRVNGLPLDPSDVLSGSADGAAAVDYVVMVGSGPFSVTAHESTGAAKASGSVTVDVTEKFGLTRDGVALSGLLEEIRDVLLRIA